jgi:hypothetical protein
VRAVPEPCDCPACTGVEIDPVVLIDDLLQGGADLLEADDPLDAELFGAMFTSAGELAGEGFAEALNDGILPQVAASGGPQAVAVLLALGAVSDAPAADDLIKDLLGAGVATPSWAEELRSPPRPGVCLRFAGPAGTASMLLCSFDRADRSHAFLVHVDHTDCDAAANIALIPGEAVGELVKSIRASVPVAEDVVAPDEFRWQVERALDARAVHDQESGAFPLDDEDEDEGPGYHLLAAVLRARMRALPEPSRPPAPHGDRSPTLSLLETLTQISDQADQIGRRRTAAPKLPPKRKKSGLAAPIYQIKVGLRGAKPPIWRRLELPADTSLAGLHRIIQTAFGWDDSHMHVFETPYGDFGIADRELGHRAEGPVTLEQVAPGAGDKLQYTYDFGDDWTHEIVVEKVLDRRPGAYPRCTGGRRAAPPDDCGGLWGYAELVEVLSDPSHPEHDERLEWLGLESADEFQPDRFDAAEITSRLTKAR